MISISLTETFSEVVLHKFLTPIIFLICLLLQSQAHAFGPLSTLASYAVGAYNSIRQSATNLIPEPIINDYPATCDLVSADDPRRFGPIQPGHIADIGIENYALFLQHGTRGEVLSQINQNQASLSCVDDSPGPISSFFNNLGNNFMPCSQTVGVCNHADHIVNMTSLCNCVIDKTGSDNYRQYVPFRDARELDTMIDAVREEFTKIALEDTLADIDKVAKVSTNLVLSEDFNVLLGIHEDSSAASEPINAHLCMGGALVHQIRELFEGSSSTEARCRPESAEMMLEAYVKLHECDNPGEDCLDYRSLLSDPRLESKSAYEKLGMVLTTQHSNYIDPLRGTRDGERIPTGNDMVFRIYDISAGTVDPETLDYQADVGLYDDPYPNVNDANSFDFIIKLIELASNGSQMSVSSLEAFSDEDKTNFIRYLRRNPLYESFFRENQDDDHAILNFTSNLIHHYNNDPNRTENSEITNNDIGVLWGKMVMELASESQKNCEHSRNKLANLCEALSGDGMALFSSPDFASIFTKLSSFESSETFAALNGGNNLAAFFRTEQVLCHANRRSLQTRCDLERQRSAEYGPPLSPENCAYDASWLFDDNIQETVAARYSGNDRLAPVVTTRSAFSTSATANRPSMFESIIPPSGRSRLTIDQTRDRILRVSRDVDPNSRSRHPLAAVSENPRNAPPLITPQRVEGERPESSSRVSSAAKETIIAPDIGVGSNANRTGNEVIGSSFRQANSFLNPEARPSGINLPTAGELIGDREAEESNALQGRLDRLIDERIKKLKTQERLEAELEQSESELEQANKERELAALREEINSLNTDISNQREALVNRRTQEPSGAEPVVSRSPASVAPAATTSRGGINSGNNFRPNTSPVPVSPGTASSLPNSAATTGNTSAGRRLSTLAGGVSGATAADAGNRVAAQGVVGPSLTLRQSDSAAASTLPVGTPISQLITRLNDQGIVLRETGIPGQTERIVFTLDESGEVLYVDNEPVFTIEIISSETALADSGETSDSAPLDPFQEYLKERRQFRWESVLNAIDTAKND